MWSAARVFIVAVVWAGSGAGAEIIFDGTPEDGPPPATLGPWDMTPFPPDPTPVYTDVVEVASPLGGEVGFSIPLSHRVIGGGWCGWSHGYDGDVYYTMGQQSVMLTLPVGTAAFYFYAEPNWGYYHEFQAITDDGTTGIVYISHGYDARYFGFYSLGGETIASIEITATADFALGEFGIAMIPAPGAAGALVHAAVLTRRRKRPAE